MWALSGDQGVAIFLSIGGDVLSVIDTVVVLEHSSICDNYLSKNVLVQHSTLLNESFCALLRTAVLQLNV